MSDTIKLFIAAGAFIGGIALYLVYLMVRKSIIPKMGKWLPQWLYDSLATLVLLLVLFAGAFTSGTFQILIIGIGMGLITYGCIDTVREILKEKKTKSGKA